MYFSRAEDYWLAGKAVRESNPDAFESVVEVPKVIAQPLPIEKG